MKTLKKLFIILLALGFVFSFASCKKDAEDGNNNGGTEQQGGGGNEQGGGGGATTAAAAWYSYEATLTDGSAWLFGADGKLTGKKNTSGETVAVEDGDQSLADLAFIAFTINGSVWTKLIMAGTDMWDESLAESCTVNASGDTVALEMAGTASLTLTKAGDEYTAEVSGIKYKFKK
ncbi:MAG: hypothetical protein J5527_04290 [Treponema sp.]|nr:hypothetical protein [Treponema sp.]